MRRNRWLTDSGNWDVDISTPLTMEGVAMPVAGKGNTLPLGLPRASTLSRAKQLDFFHKFMSFPLLPSFSGDPSNGGQGLVLQRALTLPFSFGDTWFPTLIGQCNLQKLISVVREVIARDHAGHSRLRDIWRSVSDKSFYALNFCSEYFITPSSSLYFSSEMHDGSKHRTRAAFQHKFPLHDLLLELAEPRLYVDKDGGYWDVPFSMAFDLCSTGSSSGLSYHLCIDHHSGVPKQLNGANVSSAVPPTLLPGSSIKAGIQLQKTVDVYRQKDGKVKMVQPYDLFMSEPHIVASGIIGTVLNSSFSDSSRILQLGKEIQQNNKSGLHAQGNNYLLSGDVFASLSCTAQYGNFQRLFMDLTKLNVRLGINSCSSFLEGMNNIAHRFYNKQRIDKEALNAVCPDVLLSFQQQIAGPFSFRVDSRLSFDFRNGACSPHLDDSVFSVEYALQVLGSAKAVAWWSTKHREAMVELRFFEH